jgi:fatty acid synthase subunit alpha
VLTTAREHPGKFPSPLLDIKYRRRQIERRSKQIQSDKDDELQYLADEADALQAEGRSDSEINDYIADRANHVEKEAERQTKEVLRSFGNNFWKSDPSIAPLRGALATWGLTIDDLGVASFHGTSTKANDKNESSVICQQMAHLGRKKGNAVLGIFQKYLTGHPKGAAGAWMMNGCLQVLNTGLVPGNRNADNVDQVMEQFDYIVYPSRSIQTDGVKAFSVTSFGFGQKGAQAIGVHPKYLFATLDEQTFNEYRDKVEARQKKAYRFFHNGLINNTLFVAKDKSPYTDEQLSSVLLNPDARVTKDEKTGQLTYPAEFMKLSEKAQPKSEIKATLESVLGREARKLQNINTRVGFDVEDIKAINADNDTFLERNFTEAETKYCLASATGRSPQKAFAGRWSAKEAVFKALGVTSQGAGAALKDIEILTDKNGGPTVTVC